MFGRTRRRSILHVAAWTLAMSRAGGRGFDLFGLESRGRLGVGERDERVPVSPPRCKSPKMEGTTRASLEEARTGLAGRQGYWDIGMLGACDTALLGARCWV